MQIIFTADTAEALTGLVAAFANPGPSFEVFMAKFDDSLTTLQAKFDAMQARIKADFDNLQAKLTAGGDITDVQQQALNDFGNKLDTVDPDPNFPDTGTPPPTP